MGTTVYEPRMRRNNHRSVLVQKAPRYDAFIDAILYPEDKEILYKNWNKKWGEPIVLFGGVEVLTIPMVLAVPKAAFSRAMGVDTAARIRACAEAKRMV